MFKLILRLIFYFFIILFISDIFRNESFQSTGTYSMLKEYGVLEYQDLVVAEVQKYSEKFHDYAEKNYPDHYKTVSKHMSPYKILIYDLSLILKNTLVTSSTRLITFTKSNYPHLQAQASEVFHDSMVSMQKSLTHFYGTMNNYISTFLNNSNVVVSK